MKDKEKSRDILLAEISELREEVQELKFYKAVLDQLPVCTILYDASETVIYRNKASKAIDGYEHQELVGLSRDEYLKQLHVKPGKAIKMKDPQKDSSYFKKSIYEMNETTLRTKTGTLRDVLLAGDFIYDEKENLLGACGCAVDITEHALKDIMGRSIYELRTKDLADIYTEKDSELFRTTGKQVYETVIPYADGTMHDVVLYKGVFTDSNDGVAGLVGVIIDVTKSKETQRALSESEDLYRRLVELSPELIGVHDFNGKIAFLNQAGVKLLNAKNETEIIGKNITQFIHPDYMQAVTEAMQKMHETNEPLQWFEQKLLTLEGSPVEVEATCVPLHFKGSPAVLVIARDISDRKKMEYSLRTSEEKYREIFKNAYDIIYTQDLEGNYTSANPAGTKVYGYNKSEILQLNKKDIIDSKYLPIAQAKIQNMIEGREDTEPYELLTYAKDGSQVWIEVSSRLIKQNGLVVGIQGIARDITERKRWEREMSRLERLNLIGQMAAGIGHEVRNPMTTVRGFLQMFQAKNDLMPYKNHLKLMIEELDRANSIIGQFLSLAKDKPVDKKVQNLNSVVEALSPMIQAKVFRYDTHLELKLHEIPDLWLDEKEMRQLILNLCRNGLEAMSPGGTLSITTYTEGEEVVLSVADEGKGMQPDVMENLGTPFFTTKDDGTGLGLAVCYSIAARHNASIDAMSTSEGTTFSVRFKLMGDIYPL